MAPQVRGPRSGPGTCPICAKHCGDLLEHVRQRHKTHTFTRRDFAGTDIVVCQCGRPATREGIRKHKARDKGCPFADQPYEESDAEPARPEGGRSSLNALQRTTNSGEREQEADSSSSDESLRIIDRPAVARPPVQASRLPVSTRRPVLPPPPRLSPPRVGLPPARPSFARPTASSMARPRPNVQPVPAPRAAQPRPSPTGTASSFEFETDEAALDYVASLPTTYKQLPPSVAKSFSDAAERLADTFLCGPPSDRDVLNLLCLPKIGLAPGQSLSTKDRLVAYPEVPLPKVPVDSPQIERPPPSAAKQVEAGRLGHAARILGGLSSAPSRTAETIDILKSKHPNGPRHPFGSLAGPAAHSPPSAESIVEALYSFKPDTAPGVFGWTVPLLKLAIRSESFKKMLVVLTSMILAGNAPAQGLLCSSRLVALEKPDGGVRPIAVGELIYRLCTKAVLRTTFKPDFLSTGQFGVGTKGGVEPIIRAVQRVAEGSVEGGEYTHVTSLDFSNAFNTLDRSDMAQAVKQHAPGLYRLAKWAYDKPSHLVIGGSGSDVTRILSAQGVRQGDPLGPLLFSIGIRPILEKLALQLGPDCIVLAYLDDVYILSKTDETLEEVTDFFDVAWTSLKLNPEKSSIVSVDRINATGIKMLGSCVGPPSVRRAFLKEKIAEVEQKIEKLVDVPHQHGLLLLRQCMQQDLRHLQRCLVTDDIEMEWDKLDSIIWKAALRLRSSADPTDSTERDQTILSLPVKLGGLGLLSHSTCAPLAFAAASETSDRMLESLLGPAPTPPTLTDPEDPDSISPQRVRCGKAFEAQQEALLNSLDAQQTKQILESASGLGRKWLSVIPYHQGLRLSDFEVSAALHHRTLSPGSAICSLCGVVNTAGHPEVCKKGTPWFVARHEQVKYAIKRTLETIEGVRVAVEPHIANTNRRNDLLVTGSEASGFANHEYDVTIVSLATRDSVETYVPPHILPTKPAERSHAHIRKFLALKAAEKRKRLPDGNVPFTPLVFTVGGMMDDNTAQCLKAWQHAVTPSVFSTLCQQLSLILLRAKAKSFVL